MYVTYSTIQAIVLPTLLTVFENLSVLLPFLSTYWYNNY